MVSVYAGDVVNDLIAFYKPILDIKLDYHSLFDQIKAFGTHAFDRFQTGDQRSIQEFNNYNPKYIGKTNEANILSNPSKEDFLETAANCFGYKSFKHARSQGNIPIDKSFEKAVDYLLAGDLSSLKLQLNKDPNILLRNSQYGHKAGLIHYIGSNGVEFWRQVVPSNLIEILKFLLDKGAKPDMWNNIYGNPSTLKGLIESSVHPYKAGVIQDLVKVLDDHGY